MTVEIREIQPDEYEEAGRITAGAYEEFEGTARADMFRSYLNHIADIAGRADRTLVLVAVEGGEILGTVTLELDGRVEPEDDPPLEPGEAHIRMLGVALEARGRGIAKTLMAECQARASVAGRTSMTLNTTPMMAAAQKMYESLGYERGADRSFPDGFVLLSYSKSI
jgi:ribosomal protein S18 acetylase RimI-like enzyme